MASFSGHIRKRPTKKVQNRWQIIIELGTNSKGERLRRYETFEGIKKDAQARLTGILNDLNKGSYIEPTKIKLDQYITEWLESYKHNLSHSTVQGYKVNIDNHIIPELGSFPLQQINPMQIQKFYDRLMKKPLRNGKIGLSPKSIKYIHNTLHEALEHAVRMQLIDKNPASLVITPKIKKYKASIYDEQMTLELLLKAKDTDMEVPISIAVGLGLRRGELLALTWSDIDFKQKKLEVQQNLIYTTEGKLEFKEPKTESGVRTLEIPENLIQILKRHELKQKEYKLLFGKEYKNNNLIVCHEDGSPFIPSSFSHKFERFLNSNGLPKLRLHDLRHTNASLMLQYGVPAKVASERLGHSSIGITLDLYSHVIGNMQKDAADKIDEGIFKKLNEVTMEEGELYCI